MSTIEKMKERSKEDIWRAILSEGKAALREVEGTKAGIIKRTCVRLEEEGMPLQMICNRVVRELSEFASRRHIIDSIDKKYKDSARVREYHKKDLEELDAPVTPNEQKNNLEDDRRAKKTKVDYHVEDDQEDDEIYQINVEDYRIEDVEKYDKAFLQKLVIYLHARVTNLTSRLESAPTTEKAKRK